MLRRPCAQDSREGPERSVPPLSWGQQAPKISSRRRHHHPQATLLLPRRPVLKGTGLRVCVRTGSRAFGLIKSMDQKNRKVLTQKQRVSAASRHGKSASRRSVQFSRVHLKPPTLTSTK